MTGVFIRERRGRFEHTETEGGRLCEDRDRDWGYAATNQRILKIADSHQKPEERPGRDPPSAPLQGASLSDMLMSDFLPPEL